MKEEIIIIACQRLLMRFYWRLSKESQQSTLAWTKVSQLTLQGLLPVIPYLENFLHFGKILGLIGETFYHLGILSMANLTKIAFLSVFSSYFLLWVIFWGKFGKKIGEIWSRPSGNTGRCGLALHFPFGIFLIFTKIRFFLKNN